MHSMTWRDWARVARILEKTKVEDIPEERPVEDIVMCTPDDMNSKNKCQIKKLTWLGRVIRKAYTS